MSSKTKHTLSGEADVSFNLDMTPEEFKKLFSLGTSPLKIVKDITPKIYLLEHKKYDTFQPITAGPFDKDFLQEDLFRTAVEKLKLTKINSFAVSLTSKLQNSVTISSFS